MPSPNARARVLVVDDEEGSRRIIAEILDLNGYDADTAASGPEALELARNSSYQVAVLDYRMPHMNGVQLFERLKQMCPELVGIFLTGYPTVDTVFPAIASGIERVLAKPVNTEELLDVISQAVDQVN